MKEEILARWAHSHGFGQERKRPGELRTLIVIALTTGMMAVEITAGIAYGSIALLADGLHMDRTLSLCQSMLLLMSMPVGRPSVAASALAPAR